MISLDKKILNGLSYLSIFFAPILFPIIVLIVSSDKDVNRHAIRATILHLIPVVLTIVGLIIVGATGLFTNDHKSTGFVAIALLGAILLIDLGVFIYNLVLGIKQFVN